MNYVIALDGSGDFTTIQAAIDAASAGDTLTVRPGTYEERVVVHKDGLRIIGECGAVLTGKGCAKEQYPDGREKGTFLSATLLVLGSDVTVEHMTIRNDAGDGEKVGQAVAAYAAGDRGIWKNCRLIAHQDTLFCGPVMQKVLDEIAPRTLDTVELVESTGNCPLTYSRQYFENCFIQGDVDYIFGPYRCWFENCTLYMNARGGWYTAANTPEEQPWGLVFHNCRLTGVCEPGAGNLGRPWRQFARTLFMACDMDEHVNPQGFVNWENWDGVREITDRCGEWRTTGVRADQSMRHPNQKRLTDAEAAEVTIENVLNGWKPVKESTRLEKSTMINSNPLQKGQPVGKKFITMGEIMLRLTPPNYNKIRMATSFEASYGGSEANIALALASLKVDSTFFSVVPDNAIGKSAIRALRSSDVHCTPVILSTPEETPSHRLGTYYLETGFGIRPSKVVYDRKHSALTEYDFSGYDLRGLLQDYDWLHLSGITPALSENCRKLTMDMLKVARELGLTISFDGNFRSTLWTWEEARDFCTECLPYVDVLLGIEPYHVWRDPQDHSKGDVKDGVPLQPAYEQQDEVFQAFIERWPNLKCIARHVRYAHSGSENSLKAYMWYDGHTFESKLFTFNILDRVGGGDAFASGLIYAMMHEYKPMDMLNFAVASSVIKHTIHGDANITDDVGSIRNLMNMNYDIKR